MSTPCCVPMSATEHPAPTSLWATTYRLEHAAQRLQLQLQILLFALQLREAEMLRISVRGSGSGWP